jgi:hypothetical protein
MKEWSVSLNIKFNLAFKDSCGPDFRKDSECFIIWIRVTNTKFHKNIGLFTLLSDHGHTDRTFSEINVLICANQAFCPVTACNCEVSEIKSSIFRDITPCSPLKVNRCFGVTCRLHLQGRSRWHIPPKCRLAALLTTWFRAGFCVAYSSTLKMEATYSSETSVDFQRTIRRYITEDRTVHNHRCDNLKSCLVIKYCIFSFEVFSCNSEICVHEKYRNVLFLSI